MAGQEQTNGFEHLALIVSHEDVVGRGPCVRDRSCLVGTVENGF
jgi:hypothetical protein